MAEDTGVRRDSGSSTRARSQVVCPGAKGRARLGHRCGRNHGAAVRARDEAVQACSISCAACVVRRRTHEAVAGRYPRRTARTRCAHNQHRLVTASGQTHVRTSPQFERRLTSLRRTSRTIRSAWEGTTASRMCRCKIFSGVTPPAGRSLRLAALAPAFAAPWESLGCCRFAET